MQKFKILFEDAHLLVIQKPARISVHPPEDKSIRFDPRKTVLYQLEKDRGVKFFLAHRLDQATSGVLIVAKDSKTASLMGEQFSSGRVEKTYLAVTRGWILDQTICEIPLLTENKRSEMNSKTTIFPLARIEIDVSNERFEKSRYTLTWARPQTGRKHQIRRHLKHLAHPIIGDRVHGDGTHNKIFQEHFRLKNLLLHCHEMAFTHPHTGEALRIHSLWRRDWHEVFNIFGLCPRLPLDFDNF